MLCNPSGSRPAWLLSLRRGRERERIGRVNREVCRGRGDKGMKNHMTRHIDHELPYYNAQAKFSIDSGLSEENYQIFPLSKAKRVVFDRCSFLRRTGKVPNQFNRTSFVEQHQIRSRLRNEVEKTITITRSLPKTSLRVSCLHFSHKSFSQFSVYFEVRSNF